VQGIPFCVLIDGGRPVDGFQGALRETEVKRFLQRYAIGPAAPKAAEPEEPAEKPMDPNSPEGRLHRAYDAARAGDVDGARAAIAGFPEDDERIDRVRRLEEGLAFLEAALAPSAPGAEGLLAGARARLLAGDVEQAMEQILASVTADKTFRSGLPRRAMLLCFQLAGEDDDRIDDYRRRLATLLY
jgi:putative thioredoxin